VIVDHHRSRTLEITGQELGREPATEDEAPRAHACRCALKMLAEIRPAYAEVVRRVDYDEEDPAAVAIALGVSMTNLYVRLHRARRALRERVQGHCGVSSMAPCLECTCHEHGRCGDEPGDGSPSWSWSRRGLASGRARSPKCKKPPP
jgi:RNA polymerase sigma-70 factor (ECF subfamily)